MKRMPFLQLIAAAALIVLQGASAARADNVPTAQNVTPAASVESSPTEPIRLAWDRVGAAA